MNDELMAGLKEINETEKVKTVTNSGLRKFDPIKGITQANVKNLVINNDMIYHNIFNAIKLILSSLYYKKETGNGHKIGKICYDLLHGRFNNTNDGQIIFHKFSNSGYEKVGDWNPITFTMRITEKYKENILDIAFVLIHEATHAKDLSAYKDYDRFQSELNARVETVKFYRTLSSINLLKNNITEAKNNQQAIQLNKPRKGKKYDNIKQLNWFYERGTLIDNVLSVGTYKKHLTSNWISENWANSTIASDSKVPRKSPRENKIIQIYIKKLFENGDVLKHEKTLYDLLDYLDQGKDESKLRSGKWSELTYDFLNNKKEKTNKDQLILSWLVKKIDPSLGK